MTGTAQEATTEWAASLNDATLAYALDKAEESTREHARGLDAARAKARALRAERDRRRA